MPLTIDFNCDLGEGGGADGELMPWITSANIACGGHAGDVATMRETVAMAEAHGVAVGAHPEQAFEAARTHMLVSMLPRDAETQTQRFYAAGARAEMVEQRAARLADMARVEALQNPFGLERAA